jgi:hypothetical protein
MKKIIFLLLTFFLISVLTAADLIILELKSIGDEKQYFDRDDIVINYLHRDFIIATTDFSSRFDSEIIAENAWKTGEDYYLLWMDQKTRTDYILQIDSFAEILFLKEDFMIIRSSYEDRQKVVPSIHNGVVYINNSPVIIPTAQKFPELLNREEDPLILELFSYVDQTELENTVQTLENFGTRNWYTQGSMDAQNWIYNKLDSYGLSVETQNIPYGGPNASENVIAVLEGTIYPDQFVVLGAHYDSYTFWGNSAPGADDNASGTAGIIEIARLLSEHEFKRTIVFCTFSGEEYGLHGSGVYASTAATAEMNILGYFNIDMAGYLHPGDYIHTDMIAPAFAAPLVEFYEQVCAIYLPDFPIEPGMLTGGDSDHTSFNNNGYMGIFPFEDSQNYSPFIHTPDDLNGTSVNSYEMLATFTKATLASVVTLANMLLPPNNLTAEAGDAQVILSWDEVTEADEYNIYRNDDEDPIATTSYNSYLDLDVNNEQMYSYYVTAIYSATGEESYPSNTVTAIPMPPLTLPFVDNFETSAPYWTLEGSWGISSSQYYSYSHSLSESPIGNYGNNQHITAQLKPFDLTLFSEAEVSFWGKHNIETNYDYMYFEISTDGENWTELAVFTGSQPQWTLYSYSLNDYLEESELNLRFRFYSDTYIMYDGMYIDDFTISATPLVGTEEPIIPTIALFNFPNPFNPTGAGRGLSTTIYFSLNAGIQTDAEISIYNVKGQKIRTFAIPEISSQTNSVVWNGDDDTGNPVSSGLYFYRLTAGDLQEIKKCLLIK